MKRYTFEVTGNGPFPFDMLRYDACYPASSEDAMKLCINARQPEPRTVRLVTYNPNGPTVGRWVSFLWRVEQWDHKDPKLSYSEILIRKAARK